MSAVHRSFGVDGIRVDVVAANDRLAQAVDGLLKGYGPPAEGGEAAVTVRLAAGCDAPARPSGPPRFAFPPLAAHDWSNGYLLIDDVGHLVVDPSAGTVSGGVGASADAAGCWRFVGLGLWLALLECLRARGRFMIHAAAVLNRQGQLFLLPGGRGAGKSTAAVTLVEAGWETLGDDTVFVERTAEGALAVIGHPRPFHISEEVLAHRPQLRPFARRPPPFDLQDKMLLSIEAAFPGQTRRRWQGPIRLAFPELSPRSGSFSQTLSPRQALTRLFRHSAFVFAHPQLAPGHLAALSALVDSGPAVALTCGRDVFLNSARLTGLMQEAVCHSAASA